LISDSEVDNALRLGESLILNGGDHFDIHYDVSHLERRVPSIVKKLRLLLRETYNVDNIHPIAFRVNTAGPMDGHGVNLYRSPALALNRTVRSGFLPLLLCWYIYWCWPFSDRFLTCVLLTRGRVPSSQSRCT
jgi:hypothetical protein